MNRFSAIAVLVVMSLLFTSCSSKIFGGKKNKKKDAVATTTEKPNGPQAVGTQVPVATLTTKPAGNKLIDELTPLWNTRFAYKTFSGKAKISFEGPNGSVSFSANFRIAKDSLVWVHITALGGLYPVARMLVTRDSFFMINYDQKEVTFLPLTDAAKILPVAVRFSQLQSLFTGEPLLEGAIVNAESKDASWLLHTEDSNFVQQVTYQKTDSVMTFSHLQARQSNGPSAMVDYNNYEAVSNRKLSTTRMVHIQNGVNNYTLDMNFINPEFDRSLEFPFSMPKNFTVKNK